MTQVTWSSGSGEERRAGAPHPARSAAAMPGEPEPASPPPGEKAAGAAPGAAAAGAAPGAAAAGPAPGAVAAGYAAAAPPAAPGIFKGAPVVIRGLQGAAEYNGRRGTVSAGPFDSGRYEVTVAPEAGKDAIFSR